jgi:dipeptidyl aminopeptidase/acylaminoacyl peptidase
MGTQGQRESSTTVASVFALLIVLIALALAACGGSSTTASTSPSAAPSKAAASLSASASPSKTPLPAPTVAGTIAFAKVVKAGANADIYAINTDGTGLKRLSGGPGWEERPRWSPDGRRILYSAYSRGSLDVLDAEVWVMNADGSGQRPLADPGFWACYSPDGKRIAYEKYVGQTSGFDIYVMNADGSAQKRVVHQNEDDSWPAWTPEGEILFVNAGNLYAVNPNATGVRQLTQTGAMGPFSLSSDGAMIAFHDFPGDRLVVEPLKGGGTAVMVLEPVSSSLRSPDNPYAATSWLPGGTTLGLAADDLDEFDGSRLFIVNADGSGLSVVPHTGKALDPDWRPE